MKKEIKKMFSAAVTLTVMALIRTNASPALWQISLVTMMFYGINCLIIEAVTDEIRRAKRRKEMIRDKYNLRRWAEIDFNELQHGKYIEIA